MKVYSKKQIFNAFLFIWIFFIGMLALFSNQNINNLNNAVLVSFLINGGIIFFHFLYSNEIGYSLLDMFDIFMFFFMLIAAFLQYINDKFPWEYKFLITDEIIVKSNLFIFLFCMLFYCTYHYAIKQNKLKFKNTVDKHKEKNEKKLVFFKHLRPLLKLGFYISLIVTFLIINLTGFSNLFSRSTNSFNTGNQSFNLIVNNSLRAFPLIIVLFHIKYKKIYGVFFSKWQLFFLTICTLLINFPTGLPRFQVAVVYLSLFLAVKERFNNKYFFKIMIVVGLLIVFPLINLFRNNTFAEFIGLTIKFPNPIYTFLQGDFDAYSMLNRSLIYVENYGITFGKQLLGAVFFFIPRALWPSKAIGSGAMVGESLGFSFTNVSMPLIGEGYINFGLLGIILCAIFLGKLLSSLDYKYKLIITEKGGNRIYIIEILYPLLIGYLFFIMRGDLLSSLSYTIGYSFPILFFFMLDKVIEYLIK